MCSSDLDGYEDMMMGAYYYDGAATDAGAVWIIPGAASGWSGTVSVTSKAAVTYTGAAASDYLGYSMGFVGDHDNDGVDDIRMDAYGNDGAASTAGASYLFLGGSSKSGSVSVTSATATIRGVQAADYLGYSKTVQNTPGDFNGDGPSDVIVGAYMSGLPSALTTYTGNIYLFKGGAM